MDDRGRAYNQAPDSLEVGQKQQVFDSGHHSWGISSSLALVSASPGGTRLEIEAHMASASDLCGRRRSWR